MTAGRAHLRVIKGKAARATIPGARPDRGYLAVFRPSEQNRCPGCGGQNWYVGRSTAECAFCNTAVPIASDGSVP